MFLHDAILEGYTSGDTEIVVGKMAKRMTELEALDDEGISGFRKEFQVSIRIVQECINTLYKKINVYSF